MKISTTKVAKVTKKTKFFVFVVSFVVDYNFVVKGHMRRVSNAD
jgi:hypothetical protein